MRLSSIFAAPQCILQCPLIHILTNTPIHQLNSCLLLHCVIRKGDWVLTLNDLGSMKSTSSMWALKEAVWNLCFQRTRHHDEAAWWPHRSTTCGAGLCRPVRNHPTRSRPSHWGWSRSPFHMLSRGIMPLPAEDRKDWVFTESLFPKIQTKTTFNDADLE